jgi:hypothetical protein
VIGPVVPVIDFQGAGPVRRMLAIRKDGEGGGQFGLGEVHAEE